jgi:branched-chain amino acid transport system ATP-binding protein
MEMAERREHDPGKAMLRVERISTYYGKICAISDISLDISEGELVSLLGANGAGKTTLLKAICNLLPCRSGQIFFKGQEITGLRTETLVRLGLVHIPERKQGKKGMDDFEFVFGLFPILQERKKQLGGTLSGGEQQMLAIARGLMSRPSMLLLDEPLLGLAPLIIGHMLNAISELRSSKGIGILFAEQNAKAALSISNRGYVLSLGEIVLEDDSQALLSHESVKAAYLAR